MSVVRMREFWNEKAAIVTDLVKDAHIEFIPKKDSKEGFTPRNISSR